MAATTLARSTTTRKARVITIRDLGEGVGAQDRVSLEASEWAHKQYVRASDESKREIRAQFVIGYVMGRLHVGADSAETIVSQKREERSKGHELAVNAAGQKFKYHVSRDGAKAKGGAKASAKRLTGEDKAQCVRAVHAMGFEEITKASVREAIKYLQAFAARLDA